MKLISLFLLTAAFASAKLSLPQIFSDGAVLQRDTGAKIWGWTDAGKTVEVHFAGRKLQAKSNPQGKWSVNLTGLKANSVGRDLVINAGSETKTIKDVLVGEVWIASGQSNMEWSVSNSNGGKKEKTTANDPLLRVITSANVTAATPQRDWECRWNRSEPKSTGGFTAVGYYFGKKLRAELGVPVGIIECSWGGKSVQAFTSESALKQLPEAKGLLDQKEQLINTWDPKKAQEDFQKKKQVFEKQLAEWQKEKKGRRPRGPRRQVDPRVDPGMPSTIFNGMIAPIAGYGARGAIWYQGESNANQWTSHLYEELLGCLVADWRKRWGTDFSFYYAQLANFRMPSTKPGVESSWVTVQDEMRRALKSIPKSGMAIINDIGAADDIHPRNKKDVGERLARWALAKDYARKGHLISGPLFASAESKENKMVITFEHAQGLKSRDGKPLERFEIASEDGTWQWAKASIEDGKIVVWHDKIAAPKKVRYAWADNPEGANLVNAAGLPASCFTTE